MVIRIFQTTMTVWRGLQVLLFLFRKWGFIDEVLFNNDSDFFFFISDVLKV